MTLIDEYLDLQEKYEKKYGEKTIVLMEVGSFFEIYGIVKENGETRGRIHEVAEITNLSVSKKNDKYLPVSEKNPLMAGFPNHSFEKWKEILLKHEYTIIKIEQDGHGKKDLKRDISEIISPGVNLETTQFSNNIMSIYLEEIKDYKTLKPLLFLGISVADITTGETTVYEIHSQPDDYKLVLDEIFRFLQIFSPSEIVIHSINNTVEKNNLLTFLEINSSNIHYNIYDQHTHLLQNKFKDEILRKVYNSTGLLSPVEYIHMEKMNFALNSFIYLIQFIYEHNESIIEKLNRPRIWETNSYLVLSHDSILQLNILPDRNKTVSKSISSLWNILDKTTTPMGRRMLRDNLLNPILNSAQLKDRYELVEKLLSDYNGTAIYKQIKELLKNISDIERLHRKMGIRMLNPYNFLNLDISYSSVLEIINILCITGAKELECLIPSVEEVNKLKEYMEDYNKKLHFEKLTGTNINNITQNIFQKGLYSDIDAIQDKIDYCNDYFNAVAMALSEKIEYSKDSSKEKDASKIKLVIDVKCNERDCHYLSLTNTRAGNLKKVFKEPIEVVLKDGVKNIISPKDIEWKSTSGVTKIFTDEIRSFSQNLLGYENKLMKLCLNKFSELQESYYNEYSKTLHTITSFVSNVDFLTCIAQVSSENGYCKPEIINEPFSFIEAVDLRHPIIEKINTKVQYVPNDVFIGKENQKGMLLYGVNAVGKCHGRDTPIILYDGHIKMCQDIQIGDLLMGDDSTPRKVLSTTCGNGELFKIAPYTYGDSFVVNKPHILCLKNKGCSEPRWNSIQQSYEIVWADAKKLYVEYEACYSTALELVKYANQSYKDSILEISVEQYIQQDKRWRSFWQLYHVPVEFEEKQVQIDPYELGYWLGDGSPHLTSDEDPEQPGSVSYRIKKGRWNITKEQNYLENKHIPYEYTCSSRNVRLCLLAGIIDSVGSIGNTMISMQFKNNKLAEDVKWLCQSLGYWTKYRDYSDRCLHDYKEPFYTINITGNFSDLPLKKYNKIICNTNDVSLLSDFAIESIGMGEYYGFELDGNHRYLLGDFTCTHNSSYMKSIGLSVIMAQCGFYVPARSFVYSPYKYLFTRISGNDNLFKGQSTFAVEMSELRSILKRSNEHTLVLGDELCSGTETTSALALVTAGVMRLSANRASFVFATHLHSLSTMDEIKQCPDVHHYHMETMYDEKTQKLVYNRKLQIGNGNAIYGLEVAKAMDLDEEFIGTANAIRKKLLGMDKNIIEDRVSSYNANVIISNCSICKGKTAEVHHIHEQHLANQDGMIDYFHKNNLWNLVQLCNKCHKDAHHGLLKIKGYITTTDGVELDFSYTSESIKCDNIENNVSKIVLVDNPENTNNPFNKKKKYTEEQMEKIQEVYNSCKKYSETKKILQKYHELIVSPDTIKKIIQGNY